MPSAIVTRRAEERIHNKFVNELSRGSSIALEEADEAVGFLELSQREGILKGDAFLRILDEGQQIARILAKSRETAQSNEGKSRKRRKPRDKR